MSTLLRALPLALALVSGVAAAQDAPYIRVAGEGSASAAPDLLIADVGVTVLRDSSQEAMAAAAAGARDVVRALQRAGVREADIQTRQVSVHPRYEETARGPRIATYEATQTVTVEIRDLDRAGRILDDAVASAEDAAVVHGVRFALERDEALLRAAREDAWQDARQRAEHLARLADVQLGRPIAIQEQGASVPVAFAERAVADASTPIAPGELEVTVHVVVDFAIGQPGS